VSNVKTLRLVLATLLAVPALALTAGTAQAAGFAVTSATSYSQTFFSPPNQISVAAAPGGATVELTPGGASVRQPLATLTTTAGLNPGPDGCTSNGSPAGGSADVEVTYGDTTLTFTYGVAVTWRCSHQLQLDITLPPGQSVDVGGGQMLTMTPFNNDPYASLHPTVVSGQWHDESTQNSLLMFTFTLGSPPDGTPPLISPIVSGTQGHNGWHTSPTDLAWTVSDPESAISSRTGCVDQQLTTDQPKTAYGCTATSAGGTTGPVVTTIGVDLTDPTVTCGPTPTFALNQPGGTVQAAVTDSGSGAVVSTLSAAADTSVVGRHTVALTGRDNAGRTSVAQCPYSVGYVWTGFSAPVDPGMNAAKAGQTIPLKWRVTDHTGTPVSSLSTVSVTAVGLACATGATGDQVEEYAAGASGLQNLGAGFYQFNWKTPAGYASSCKTVRVGLGDGAVHTADFTFRR
jgi:hypothetical protein